MNSKLDLWLDKIPAIAILRGVTPDEVIEIGTAVFEAGIGVIEVPLNSPAPFSSIKKLDDALGAECVIGCGTCVTLEDTARVAEAGGQIVVTPNTDTTIIKKSIELGMTPVPGWATPSEAFAAYAAGARHLKLFPASTYGVGHIKAVRAVLPADAQILAVGGVGANDTQEWLATGVSGFGFGSDIYKAGRCASDVHDRCLRIVESIKKTAV